MVIDVERVLPGEDGRVGGVLDVLAARVHLDDLGVLLGGVLPVLQRPEELAVVVAHLVGVLVLREVIEEHLVDELVERVGVAVLRLLGFLVPDERQLLGRVVEGVAALLQLVLLDALHVADLVEDGAQALDLLDLVLLVAGRERVAHDLVLPLADARRIHVLRDDLLVDAARVAELTLLPVELGQRFHHLRGVVAARALEELPGLLGTADVGVGLDDVLLGLFHQRLLLRSRGLDLRVARHADDADEGLERGLVVALVDVAPALFIDGVRVDAGVGELLDLLVELEGVVHLALVEVVLGERQVGVRDVLAVRVVLDEAVEELARLVFLLHRRQQEGEAEQHLVHALVLPELGRADVRLDRLEQPLLLLGLVALLLVQQRAALVRRHLVDLLIEGAGLAEVVVLLLGVELAEAEQKVRLLGIVVAGDLNEAAHLADLGVDQLDDPFLLLADELIDGQDRTGLLLLGRRRFRLGEVGLLRRDLRLLLRVAGLPAVGGVVAPPPAPRQARRA